MPRALVIGGTLFIGRALVEQLLARGDEVTVMHRGATTPFGERVQRIRCDRNDVSAVRAALKGKDFEVVYDNVYDMERGTSADQVKGAVLASASGSLKRYVFMSTIAVYGAGSELVEDSPLAPSDDHNIYGAQKADSERMLFELHRRQGVPVTTLRPTFIYGPDNAIDREAWFWDRIVTGRPVIVPDAGERRMQWVYVQDVARAAVIASESDKAIGRAYNLCNYPAITQREFVELLGRVAGRETKVVPVSREELLKRGGQLFGHPAYFGVFLDLPPMVARSDRVRAELGFEFTPLEAGLRETFGWYRRQSRPNPDYSWEDEVVKGR